MAKKFFKRWTPDPNEFKRHPALSFISHLLHDPNLFHLNRHSVSGGVSLGLFIAFLPILGQMPLAALLALLLRVNVPIAVAFVWVSNPLTIPPIFFASYELGRLILDTPPLQFKITLSWEWFTNEFTNLWKPLLVGSLIASCVASFLGYVITQLYWRWQVVRHWEQRQALRKKKKTARREPLRKTQLAVKQR